DRFSTGPERACQLFVDVVWGLGAGPQCQLARLLEVPVGETCMLLKRQMGVALKKVGVFEDVVGLGQRRVDVAELEGCRAMGIAEPAFVNRFAGFAQAFFNG